MPVARRRPRRWPSPPSAGAAVLVAGPHAARVGCIYYVPAAAMGTPASAGRMATSLLRSGWKHGHGRRESPRDSPVLSPHGTLSFMARDEHAQQTPAPPLPKRSPPRRTPELAELVSHTDERWETAQRANLKLRSLGGGGVRSPPKTRWGWQATPARRLREEATKLRRCDLAPPPTVATLARIVLSVARVACQGLIHLPYTRGRCHLGPPARGEV